MKDGRSEQRKEGRKRTIGFCQSSTMPIFGVAMRAPPQGRKEGRIEGRKEERKVIKEGRKEGRLSRKEGRLSSKEGIKVTKQCEHHLYICD